jgi:hypothetical protein
MNTLSKPMKTMNGFPLFACGTLLSALLAGGAIAACDDSSSDGVHETLPDSSTGSDTSVPPGNDAGGGNDTGTLPDGAPAPDDCVVNPTTHVEIINACTDASKFDKTPNLPGLLADGGLPALP